MSTQGLYYQAAIRLLVRELIACGGLVVGREVRLRSGVVSRIYVDARRLLSSPKGRSVASLLLALRSLEFAPFEAVVGVATGGIAWAVLVAERLGLPAGYVRPEAKDHGLRRLVEGVDPTSVVLIDDVSTTGGALEEALKVLLESGYDVRGVVVLVDRCMGAKSRIEKYGVRFERVTTLPELVRIAAEYGIDISKVQEEVGSLKC